MLRVGLTGGIGAGKSTVARLLVSHGALLIDADLLARQALERGSSGLAAVVELFGPSILDVEGRLDRSALARLVFSNSRAREQLNAVVHPWVRRRTEEAFAAAPTGAVVVNDVPLLVEAGLEAGYHLVLVVDVPAQVRVARLVAERGMDVVDARARVAAQADDATRAAAADVLISNTGSLEALESLVDQVWDDRLAPYAANLAARRPAAGAAQVVASDPRWPRAASRIAARVAAVLGGARVEHVGPTSVPGLPAPDVLDLLVEAPDAATSASWTARLGIAGFFPGAQSDSDLAVLHTADPCRAARLRVEVAGSPGWLRPLLVRDWLRADPSAGAELADHLRRLPGASSAEEVEAAGDGWERQALPRAQAWAAAAGWTAVAGAVPTP